MMMLMTGAALLTLAGLPVAAADQAEKQVQAETKSQVKKQAEERIYGSQIMTEQERAEHRAQLSAAKTAEERERIRNEHHEKMKLRAKERGVTIPDEPPAAGMGKGMGTGGGGMAPGGGMGGGRGGR
jgi:septal ring factor EnvC (AmiA/AmiB activator)